MRIAHVTSGLVRSAAGVREVVAALSRAQLDLGHEVAVFGLNDPAWAAEADSWPGAPAQAFRVLGPRALGYAPGMRAGIEAFAPDIVHLHGLWMHPGRSVLQWHNRTGGPYVLSPHGMLSEVALGYSPLKKRMAGVLFQKAVFRHAAALHVTSNQEADEAGAYGLPQPFIRFPNGVSDIRRPIGATVAPPFRVLSLGRISRIKALDHLITAWASLEDAFPDWTLSLTGPDEGGETARLQALATSLDVSRLRFHPPLFGEAKVMHMAQAQIFALPTLSENFAITVAESLMLEVPVVASKGAPWPGLERERCGLWVDIGPDAMAAGLRILMEASLEERREMGRRGRSWMLRDYSWPKIAELAVDGYMTLLKDTP
jgi:glycosyltransferase involved in cell wall biosynthesis